MPKSKIASILWTERALQNAISIKKYLALQFSVKEVDNFIDDFGLIDVANVTLLFTNLGILGTLQAADVTKIIDIAKKNENPFAISVFGFSI